MVNTAGPIDVLVVGAGMYVCGKGTDGYGTILPALFEAHRLGLVGRIQLAATSLASAGQALAKATALAAFMGVAPAVEIAPCTAGGAGPRSYQTLLTSSSLPQAAIVSVPDEHHFAIAGDLISRGLHTLVVKPLAASVDEVLTLTALAREHDVYGAVEYHKRFDEANLKLLSLIRQGSLGRLLNIAINYSQRKSIPTKAFRSWVESTDIFQYLGVHYVDLIQFLTGAQPRQVMAVGSKKHLIAQGINTWDTIQTLIQWRDAAGEVFLSSHLTGWVDPDSTSAMSDQRLEVIGSKGRYRSDQKHRGVELVTDEGGVEAINPYFTQFYPTPDDTGMSAAGYGPRSVIQFIDDCGAIVRGEKKASSLAGLRATFASSVPVAQVIEANRQSLTTGSCWIDIEPIL